MSEEIVEKVLAQNSGYWVPVRQSEIADMASLGTAAPLLMWLRADAYYTEQSESYSHVGSWVRNGFVVAAFTRQKYAELTGISTRQVNNQLTKLREAGQIQSVGGGASLETGNLPHIAIVGAWELAPNPDHPGQSVRRPCFAGWRRHLREMARAGDDWALNWCGNLRIEW